MSGRRRWRRSSATTRPIAPVVRRSARTGARTWRANSIPRARPAAPRTASPAVCASAASSSSWKLADMLKIAPTGWRATTVLCHERAAIAESIDLESDRLLVIAAADEVCVQRVHPEGRIDGEGRGPQRLRHDLPAVQPTPRVLRTDADIRVGPVRLEGHHRGEVHRPQSPGVPPRRQTRAVLFAELVATSAAVTSTSARSAKIAALADLLARLDDRRGRRPPSAMLTGAPRQGRIGVGWRTRRRPSTSPPADDAVARHPRRRRRSSTSWPRLRGPGSNATRSALLTDVFERATADEADFLRRLLTGELRQGALAGVMADAVRAGRGRARDARCGAPRCSAAISTRGRVRGARPTGADGLAAVGLAAAAAGAADAGGDVARRSPTRSRACGLASVEWKLDGIRIQVHRDGDDVRIYTRNLNDVTDRLPGRRRAGRGRCPPTRSCSTARRSAWTTTNGRELFQDTMSRFDRRRRGSAPSASASSTAARRRRRSRRPAAARAARSARARGRAAGASPASSPTTPAPPRPSSTTRSPRATRA